MLRGVADIATVVFGVPSGAADTGYTHSLSTNSDGRSLRRRVTPMSVDVGRLRLPANGMAASISHLDPVMLGSAVPYCADADSLETPNT